MGDLQVANRTCTSLHADFPVDISSFPRFLPDSINYQPALVRGIIPSMDSFNRKNSTGQSLLVLFNLFAGLASLLNLLLEVPAECLQNHPHLMHQNRSMYQCMVALVLWSITTSHSLSESSEAQFLPRPEGERSHRNGAHPRSRLLGSWVRGCCQPTSPPQSNQVVWGACYEQLAHNVLESWHGVLHFYSILEREREKKKIIIKISILSIL